MHFLSFISVISQNETDYHNVTFWENSSEDWSWVGWDQPGVSRCFFGRSLLALQNGWWSCNCTCVKSHLGTEMQYCGWRHIDGKVLGWFVFFSFWYPPAFFGWGVKFSRHSHSRLLSCASLNFCMRTGPKLVCTLAGGSVAKMCLLLQLLQHLGFVLVVQVVEILCSLSVVLQQVLEREQYQQNWNAVSCLMQFVFCFLNKDLKYGA